MSSLVFEPTRSGVAGPVNLLLQQQQIDDRRQREASEQQRLLQKQEALKAEQDRVARRDQSLVQFMDPSIKREDAASGLMELVRNPESGVKLGEAQAVMKGIDAREKAGAELQQQRLANQQQQFEFDNQQLEQQRQEVAREVENAGRFVTRLKPKKTGDDINIATMNFMLRRAHADAKQKGQPHQVDTQAEARELLKQVEIDTADTRALLNDPLKFKAETEAGRLDSEALQWEALAKQSEETGDGQGEAHSARAEESRLAARQARLGAGKKGGNVTVINKLDPDGNLPTTRGATTKLMGSLTDLYDINAQLSDIETYMGDIREYKTLWGRAVTKGQNAWSYFGTLDAEGKARFNRAVNLDTNLGRLFNTFRKIITGAAAPAAELKLLMEDIPNKTDSPAKLEAKVRNFILQTKRAIRIRHHLLREGVPVSDEKGSVWSERFSELYDNKGAFTNPTAESRHARRRELTEYFSEKGLQGRELENRVADVMNGEGYIPDKEASRKIQLKITNEFIQDGFEPEESRLRAINKRFEDGEITKEQALIEAGGVSAEGF